MPLIRPKYVLHVFFIYLWNWKNTKILTKCLLLWKVLLFPLSLESNAQKSMQCLFNIHWNCQACGFTFHKDKADPKLGMQYSFTIMNQLRSTFLNKFKRKSANGAMMLGQWVTEYSSESLLLYFRRICKSMTRA